MSLLRLRSISKPCFSLARHSTSFTCRNLSTETNNRLLISSFNKHSCEQHFFSAPVHEGGTIGTPTRLFTLETGYMGLEPSQNLNGYFCFRHSSFVHTYYKNNPIYICNPKTKSVISLPQDEPLSIGYDERIIHVKYYFGFDPLSDQHKVLCVRLVQDDKTNQNFIRVVCKIITVGTDSWREVDSFMPFDHKDDFICEGICVNGAIHWIAKPRKVIVAFDVGEEKFRVVLQYPTGYDDGGGKYRASIFDHQRLIQVGGCLALIDDKFVWGIPDMLELWMLNNYKKQVWIKEGINFPFRWISSERPIPVGAINTGEILLTARNLGEYQAWTLYYDMKKKSFRSDEFTGLPNWVFSSGARIKFITAYEEPEGIQRGSVDHPQIPVHNMVKKENGNWTLDIGHDIF